MGARGARRRRSPARVARRIARLAPVARLTFTVEDLYPPTHWALRGTPPAFDTPDEDVYLTGRNIVLLSKAGIYCAQQKLSRIAIGPLAGNPFPGCDAGVLQHDGARAVARARARRSRSRRRLSTMDKSDVIRLGAELGVPFELTLSCMNPRQGLHCGQCSKCRERRDAFHEAGITDPTAYASRPLAVISERC